MANTRTTWNMSFQISEPGEGPIPKAVTSLISTYSRHAKYGDGPRGIRPSGAVMTSLSDLGDGPVFSTFDNRNRIKLDQISRG